MKNEGTLSREDGGIQGESVVVHYGPNGVVKLIEFRDWWISVEMLDDGFSPTKPVDANPSGLGVPKRESAVQRINGEAGSVRWLSPRGAAIEKGALFAWVFLLGAALYKRLSHFFGF
jgi:hypothetical protein